MTADLVQLVAERSEERARAVSPCCVRYVRHGVRHGVRLQAVAAPRCAACAASAYVCVGAGVCVRPRRRVHVRTYPHMPHMPHIRTTAPFHAARDAARHAAHNARARDFSFTSSLEKGVVVGITR